MEQKLIKNKKSNKNSRYLFYPISFILNFFPKQHFENNRDIDIQMNIQVDLHKIRILNRIHKTQPVQNIHPRILHSPIFNYKHLFDVQIRITMLQGIQSPNK
jgi:hypothetical protein